MPRTSLQKGRACTSCRRRKIKCDAKQPTCGPCIEVSSHCEYSEDRATQIRSLEDEISVLEARLRDLESGGNGSKGNVDLQQTGSEVYLYPPTYTSDQVSPSGFEDLPPMIHRMLMHNFLHKSCSLGFFLHKERFRNSVLQSVDTSTLAPTCALLNTSYLWGMHLSSSGNPPEQEAALVSRALQSSAHALLEEHPQKVIQCIQSEVLLANYFYRADKILQARYHGTSASSLVLSSGSHRIRTPSPEASGQITVSLNLWVPPTDAVEEGERINEFWTVLILDTFWNTIYGIPSSIPYTTTGCRVDSPWPRMMEDYTESPFHPDFRSSQTITRFLSGVTDNNNSPKAILAKAAVLFERATFAGLEFKSNPGCQEPLANFNSLDNIIQRFIENIPPIERQSKIPLDYQLCMCSLAHASDIQLHRPFAVESNISRTRILKAADAIVELIDLWASELDFIESMLAVIWAITCRVFIDESVRLQCMEALSHRSDTQTSLHASCEHIMTIMEAHPFPLMRNQLSQIKQALAAT